MLFRYFAREILASSLLVLAALLALFGFFDLIKELDELGRGNYRLTLMLAYVALSLPTHAYVLMPAAGLMGTLFALARMSEQSEITVMRASGLSLAQLAFYVAGAGVVIALLTTAAGELLAPYTEDAARSLRLKATSAIVAREFRSGFWVKDDKSFVNIQDVTADTELINLRVYEFDASYRLIAISRAEKAVYVKPNDWDLMNVEITQFDGDNAILKRTAHATWHSALTPDILAVLKVNPERLSVLNLRAYIEHLRENHQKSTRYEIAFWNKFFYPVDGMALMILAIPFALGSTRAGGVGAKIVLGIIIGLIFHFGSRLFSHAGLLNDWPALVSAGFPLLAVAAVAAAGLTRAELR
jgi:lipopolysaccharide export system permease protein